MSLRQAEKVRGRFNAIAMAGKALREALALLPTRVAVACLLAALRVRVPGATVSRGNSGGRLGRLASVAIPGRSAKACSPRCAAAIVSRCCSQLSPLHPTASLPTFASHCRQSQCHGAAGRTANQPAPPPPLRARFVAPSPAEQACMARCLSRWSHPTTVG